MNDRDADRLSFDRFRSFQIGPGWIFTLILAWHAVLVAAFALGIWYSLQ